jgi:hypothetical protein
MKKYILAILFVLMSVMPSQSASVSKIVGLTGACDTTAAGCSPVPSNFAALCNQFVVGVSCPKTFHPSFVSNARFWGSDGTNCVTSSNTGVNWGNCTTQPFAGTSMQVASSTNGNVVAVSSPAGVCTIKLSVDNGANWTTQFTDANDCSPVPSGSSLVRCQVSGGQCDYVFVNSGVRTRTYRTVDNGVSWAQSNVASALIASTIGMVFNGTIGASGGTINAGQVPVIASSGTWGVGSVGWPVATNNYGSSTGAIWDSLSAPVFFAFDGSVTFQYKQLDVNGAVLKSFVPVGAIVTGFPKLDCFQFKPTVDYCVGATTTGGQAFWISIDDLATTILLGSNTANSGQATIFSTGGAIYISVAGTVGAFYKIS